MTNDASNTDRCQRAGRVPASLQALFVHNNKANSHSHAFTKDTEQKSSALLELVSVKDGLGIGSRRSWRERCCLQQYFDSLLHERGYDNVQTYDTLSTGYHCPPTKLQLASYGPKLIQMVKKNNVAEFKEALTVAGTSPNPCNKYGESLVHMACRRGYAQLLRVMVEGGAALLICDDNGRTPLHDACWATPPAFDIVEQLVIDCDQCLWFLRDSRGALPLSYVPKNLVQTWKDWLDAHMDRMFVPQPLNLLRRHRRLRLRLNKYLLTSPPGNSSTNTESTAGTSLSRKTCPKPESLSLELIEMVAKGVLSPREARIMADIAQRGDDEVTVDGTVSTDRELDKDNDDFFEDECPSSEYDINAAADDDSSYSKGDDAAFLRIGEL